MTTYLNAAAGSDRRVKLIIQNLNATAVVTLRFSTTGSTGIELKPSEIFTIDNYNGALRMKSTLAATDVHIAYALC